MKKKCKLIALSEGTIKTLSKKAIDEGTVFKLYVESLLENIANKK